MLKWWPSDLAAAVAKHAEGLMLLALQLWHEGEPRQWLLCVLTIASWQLDILAVQARSRGDLCVCPAATRALADMLADKTPKGCCRCLDDRYRRVKMDVEAGSEDQCLRCTPTKNRQKNGRDRLLVAAQRLGSATTSGRKGPQPLANREWWGPERLWPPRNIALMRTAQPNRSPQPESSLSSSVVAPAYP